jgi:hypothetical protein
MLSTIKTAFSRKIHKQESEKLLPFTIVSSSSSKSIASSAQQRIWLDQQIHFDPLVSPALYNILVPLTIKRGSMPIACIRSAIAATLERHTILRTAVYFNENIGQLEQAVQPIMTDFSYSFQVTYGEKSPEEIDTLLRAEFNTQFAQVERGLIARCHLIKMGVDTDDNLHADDIIIFVFHHIAFDISSVGPFVDAFMRAYDGAESVGSSLQYIDYALYEQTLLVDPAQDSKMNQARRFWSTLMEGYDWNKNYSLLIGSTRNTKMRSGRGQTISFALNSDLVDAQMQYAMSNNVSMFQLGFSCFLVFLYRLCNSDADDFCVGGLTANRLLPETKTMIGMFVNLLPYRIKIYSSESFIDLILRVRQLCIDVFEYAQLPYQEIIGNMGNSSSSRIPFHFHYESAISSLTYESTMDGITKHAIMRAYPGRNWSHSNGTALNDLTLIMTHNHHERTTHFIFEYSTDLFNEAMMSSIARRFQHLLSQIFYSSAETLQLDQSLEPISKLSLLLLEDVEEIQHTVFYRLSSVDYTGMTFPVLTLFASQIVLHSQKNRTFQNSS